MPRVPWIKPAHIWFNEARFGLFIHWGIYSLLGRGEQVLYREHLDPAEYAQLAEQFDPCGFDADQWALCAKRWGMKYAVLTAKHHDGFCLFDSAWTDYSSAKRGPKRDFVAEYVHAFRKRGFKVGLYYSLADWSIPSYFLGPKADPKGFERLIKYIHAQVRELCANYGKIDILWFDGDTPYISQDWQSERLLQGVRRMQPGILVNDRLGADERGKLGDFGTSERRIEPQLGRLWESCQVSTWRLWGYAKGERWKEPAVLLDMLCETASLGGNLLLNVGVKPDGSFPEPFTQSMDRIGVWIQRYGEAIHGTQPGISEFVTYGRQTVKDRTLYLLVRFWPGEEIRLPGIKSRAVSARILGAEQEVEWTQEKDVLILKGLPLEPVDDLCSVIAVQFQEEPKVHDWARHRLWQGDPTGQMAQWSGQG